MKLRFLIVLFFIGGIVVTPQIEAQSLKDLFRKKKNKRKRNKRTKKIKSIPQEKKAVFGRTKVEFNHPQLIDFEIPTYKGKRIVYNKAGYNARNILEELRLNKDKINALAHLVDYGMNTNNYRMALKKLLRPEAYDSYFRNLKFKNSPRKGYAKIWGGEKANEFAKRRVVEAFENSGIKEAVLKAISQFPEQKYSVKSIGLPKYDFKNEKYDLYIDNRFTYPLSLSPEKAESFLEEVQKKPLYLLTISSLNEPKRWEIYRDPELKILFKTIDKSSLYEGIKTRRGFVRVPYIEAKFDKVELDKILTNFMQQCEKMNGFGAYNCECLKPRYIAYITSKIKSPNQLIHNAVRGVGFLKNACENQTRIMFVPGMTRGIFSDAPYKTSGQSFPKKRPGSVIKNSCDVLSDLQQGKGTLLFREGVLNNINDFWKAVSANNTCRNKEKIYKNALEIALRKYEAYVNDGGGKTQEEFSKCYATKFTEMAMGYRYFLSKKVIDRTSSVALFKCK